LDEESPEIESEKKMASENEFNFEEIDELD